MFAVPSLFILVVLIMIGVTAARSLLRVAQVSTLQRTGTRVAATVTNLTHERRQTNAGTLINGIPQAPTYRDDWFVEATWSEPSSGQVYTFLSDRLAREDAERYSAGSPITVLIDPANPASYYVEVAH